MTGGRTSKSAVLKAPDPALRAADSVRLARGVGISAATIGAYSIRALYGVLVARVAGGTALGVYVLAFAWADLLSQVGLLGLDGTAMTFTARAAGVGRPSLARDVLNRAVAVSLAASAALASLLLVAVGTGLVALVGTPGLAPSLGILAFAIPALAVARICTAVAQGLGAMQLDFYANGLVGSSLMPIGFLAAHAAGAGPESAAIGSAAGAIGAATAGWIGARGLLARQLDTSSERLVSDGSAGLVRFARPIAGVSILNLAVLRLDILLLGIFTGSAPGVTPLALGAYAAAADVAGGLRKFRQLFDTAFAPMAARAQARGDRGALSASFAQVAGWMLLLACPAVALAALSGRAALRLYGPFDIAAPWLAVLAVATAAHGFLGLFETLLMTRRPALNLRNSAVAVAIQAAVSLLLIPRYGPIGAALGVFSAYTTLTLLRVAAVRAIVGLGVPWRSMRRPMLAAAVASIPAATLRGSLSFPAGEMAAAIAFLAAYIAALRVMGFERGDRDLLRNLRGRGGQADEGT